MQAIQDMTSTDLVNLRRTLYLTIMSSATFEEAGHKLLKLRLPPEQEPEVCAIILECCGQEKTYMSFYGLLAQRFCGRMVSYACAPPPPRRPSWPLLPTCRTTKPPLPHAKVAACPYIEWALWVLVLAFGSPVRVTVFQLPPVPNACMTRSQG